MEHPAEDRIWELVTIWEEKRQEGIELSAEEVCRNDSGFAEAVTERIEAIKRMDFLTNADDNETPSHPPADTSDSFDFLVPAQRPDEIGRLGPFRILKLLGKGGMGIVFLAEDLNLQRQVAIKVITPAHSESDTARKRFLREAQAAAGINHDNIVTIYQVGQHEGVLFMAMQLLDGESLEDRLKCQRNLAVMEAIKIGTEVAQGLAAAHAKGLIHRDIKPSNLWLDSQNDRTIILDFGLARSQQRQTSVTKVGEIVGTPAYLSPEQARGEKIDYRTDLFSLGSVLYQMVTGQQPFPGKDTISVLLSLANDTPAVPHEVNPQIPKPLSDLIMQMLAKNPAGRPSNAEAVAATLASISQQFGGSIEQTVFENAATETKPLDKPAIGNTAIQFLFRSKRRLFIVALLALICIGAFVLLTRKTNPSIDLVRQFVGHAGTVNAVVFSPDGKRLLSGGSDGTVRLWNVESGAEIRQFVGHSQAVMCACFTPDGKKAITGSRDATLRLWDVASGKQLAAYTGHDPPGLMRQIHMLKGGTHFLSCGYDRTIRAWNITSETETRLIRLDRKPLASEWILAFSADGQFIMTAGEVDQIGIWDLLTERQIGSIQGTAHRGAFCPDGKFFVTSDDDGIVQIWDFPTNKKVVALKGHRGLTNIAIDRHGSQIITNDEDGVLRLWEMPTGVEIARKSDVRAHRLAYSPENNHVVSAGADGTISLWKLP